MQQNYNIIQYFTDKGIEYIEEKTQLKIKCPVSNCDNDSRATERHFYINKDSGLCKCHKCDWDGNLWKLSKELGDDPKLVNDKYCIGESRYISKKINMSNVKITSLSFETKKYLKSCGICDSVINSQFFKEIHDFEGKWVGYPLMGYSGELITYKLRSLDINASKKHKYLDIGTGVHLFGVERLNGKRKTIFITEGEKDAMVLNSHGLTTVSSTGGAGTFKVEWINYFKDVSEVVIIYDNDIQGRKGAEKLQQLFFDNSTLEIKDILLPKMIGKFSIKDVSDYVVALREMGKNFDFDEFMSLSKDIRTSIDTTQFEEMGPKEILEVTSQTIKGDRENQLVTFLAMLTCYTEDSQLNVSFNAPSSSGKTYIAQGILKLFPEVDQMPITYATPTAFFHMHGEWDENRKGIVVDLEKRIIVFYDQPNPYLLEKIRPLLSHDSKEQIILITDKKAGGGNKTKNVILRGYPVLIYCSASMHNDEQESTRFILLSPETNSEKIALGIRENIKRSQNSEEYDSIVERNPKRRQLKQRILAIKEAQVADVNIPFSDEIEKRFIAKRIMLKSRHQRDVKKLMNLIKAFALLNIWHRERINDIVIANEKDVDNAFDLWDAISLPQEYGLPPFVLGIYSNVLVPIAMDKAGEGLGNRTGIERKEILKKYYEYYGTPLSPDALRQQFLPALEVAGLIYQEKEGIKMFVYVCSGIGLDTVSGGGGTQK